MRTQVLPTDPGAVKARWTGIDKGFNDLPDDARASLSVVCWLYEISPATVWRRVKSGLIPAPIEWLLSASAANWQSGTLSCRRRWSGFGACLAWAARRRDPRTT